jgi:ANTAR domain
MSRVPYGVITSGERDQVAEDRDEAAWRRDLASAARDVEAEDRDRRAECRMQAAGQYGWLIRRLLDATGHQDGQQPGADQRLVVALGVLRHLDEALRDADEDRQAASSDRRAAAADRRLAAEDRFIKAAHREQAAIERAQQDGDPVGADHGRGRQLYESAHAARARAEAVRQHARDLRLAAPPAKDLLRHSELARLRAQLATMPVIEQAKGIIMVQSGCGEGEAFDLLRLASQRLNQPVRDLAAQIVARATGTSHPAPGLPKTLAPPPASSQAPTPVGVAAGSGGGGADRVRRPAGPP